jgi:ParB family chromosome partitioning protein
MSGKRLSFSERVAAEEAAQRAASSSAGVAPAADPARPVLPANALVPGSKAGGFVGRVLKNSNLGLEAEKEQLSEKLKNAEARAEELAAKVRHLEDGTTVFDLNATRVRPSPYADRHPAAFADAAFEDLCERIRQTHGNTQPAKVRPINGDPDHDFEIASGHRRHAACLKLGLLFSAIVRPYSDDELLREMVEENTGRHDLSPYERGMHFSRLIETGKAASGRELAIKLGLNQTFVTRLLRYGQIPGGLLRAFRDPREIRRDWIEPLLKAWANDRARVESEIQAVLSEPDPLRSTDIYHRLVKPVGSKAIIASREAVIARVRTIHGCPAFILRKDASTEMINEIRAVIERYAQDAARDDVKDGAA